MEDNTRSKQDFFIEEYRKMAEAHFSICQRITTFFQYMIAIYAAPIFLFTERISIGSTFRGVILVIVGIIGIFIWMYIAQLRNESLLYARAVNSHRNFLYNHSGLGYQELNYYLVLPTQKEKPPYTDYFQFIWISLSSVVANTCYIVYGLRTSILVDSFLPEGFGGYYNALLWLVIVLFQGILYSFFCQEAENGTDMYRHIMGVDIDGVLNEQVVHFCEFVEKSQQISIRPEQITRIPVSDAAIGVDHEVESKVFNNKKYWETMPVRENVKYHLNRIRDTYGYKIMIFTWRAWGDKKQEFCDTPFKIKKITKMWLDQNDIPYDSITFEKGNYCLPIKLGEAKYLNRFYISKQKRIKYFVEDEYLKALKLSQVCKYVFLVDQPYNRNVYLPYNLIRVKGWKDIYDHIKILQ